MNSEYPRDHDELSPPSQDMEEPARIDWSEIVSVLVDSRKLIGVVTGSVVLLSIIVSLFLPEYYRSTTTLLPESEKGKLSMLGGLSDLAALAGVNVAGEASLAKLYPTIIRSEAVLRNVIYAEYRTKKFRDPVNLVRFWEISERTPEQEFEVALKSLRDDLEVLSDSKTNVVSISIESREPELSADILNRVAQELDRFIRTKRTSNATEQRRWIESRLEEVKGDLEKSENKLKEFRENNRRPGDSPQLLLTQGRLTREVEINSTMYVELKKQYELVKIEEIKNIPIISVMDSARPAAYKERPRKKTIVVSSLIVSLLGMSVFAVSRHFYGAALVGFYNGIRVRGKSQ